MQSQDQKHLEQLIDSILSTGFQNLQAHSDEIIKLLSSRVDMPKHLITLTSKKLSVKQQQKISLLFDILWFVTEKYDNKIVLFNQISGNKEFLFKIQSILSLKEINENLKMKIIDIVYQWKQMYKENKELFPNFWNFYNNFEKKGYVPSNLNFQTRYQQQIHRQNASVASVNQVNSENKDANIFDLIEGEHQENDFSKIEKHALHIFYNLLKKIIAQNKIISNTSPQILDIPPVLKQNMADIKIIQETINKFLGEHKNKVTIDTTMDFIKSIHLTQKRYTELITKYLPQKFDLTQRLKNLQQFCIKNQASLKLNEPLKNDLDLLNLDNNQKKLTNDLLDLNISTQQNEPKNDQKSIKSFFGNLLDKVNAPPQQVTLSDKPIENDFKTDMDFTAYQDSKTVKEHYDKIRNLTAHDLFKF